MSSCNFVIQRFYVYYTIMQGINLWNYYNNNKNGEDHCGSGMQACMRDGQAYTL